MKKLILSSALVLALCLSFTSCREKKEADTTDGAAVENAVEQAEEVAADAAGTVEDAVDEATDAVEGAVEDAKEAVEGAVEDAKDAVKKAVDDTKDAAANELTKAANKLKTGN